MHTESETLFEQLKNYNKNSSSDDEIQQILTGVQNLPEERINDCDDQNRSFLECGILEKLPVKILAAILEKGADANVKTTAAGQPSILQYAIERLAVINNREAYCIEITGLHLKHGANPNTFTVENKEASYCNIQSPLMCAIENSNVVVVNMLLEKGASANIDPANIPVASSVWFNTPLTLAVRQNEAEITGLLLDRGARPDVMIHGQSTALSLAINNLSAVKNQKAEIIFNILVAHGANSDDTAVKDWERAVKNNIPARFFSALKLGRINDDGWSPLFYAAWHNKAEVAKVLVANDVDGEGLGL
jgi:ankyrin repeat protein